MEFSENDLREIERDRDLPPDEGGSTDDLPECPTCSSRDDMIAVYDEVQFAYFYCDGCSAVVLRGGS